MKTIVAVLVTTLLLTSAAWSGQHTATVKSVKDGDTLIVEIKGEQVQIQLLGIDAPEDVPNPKLQKDTQRTKLSTEKLIAIGKLATEHLAELATPGKEVTVEAILSKKDTYGRIPAVVTNVALRNVNAAMVQDGYAVVLGRYPFDAYLKETLQKLQTEAITAKRGLWKSQPEIAKAWSGK